MKHALIVTALWIGCVAAAGCGPKVLIPPDVDLASYGTIGVSAFASDKSGNFAAFLNDQFLETLSRHHRSARFVELPAQKELLRASGFDHLSPDAVNAICKKYNVDALIAGRLDLSNIKPQINLVSDLGLAMHVSANIDAKLAAKLHSARDGAILWAASAQDSRSVANACVVGPTGISLNARDPDKAYGEMVNHLLKDLTHDLRGHYVRRKT